jgi:hypothetical protein
LTKGARSKNNSFILETIKERVYIQFKTTIAEKDNSDCILEKLHNDFVIDIDNDQKPSPSTALQTNQKEEEFAISA